MSLLGIDVGTTGCKAAVFSTEGRLLATAYAEYDVRRPQPGWAEMDAVEVWAEVKGAIGQAVAGARGDPVRALAVSSLGEAMVPVAADRRILGPSLLNFDARGEEYLPALRSALDPQRLFRITGNTLGNHYSLTKLMWVREHEPGLYEAAYQFLPWESLVSYMVGADPVVDYSLANRTLLFDLERESWSTELVDIAGLDGGKLPRTAPAGTAIGQVAPSLAHELGLPEGVAIVAGAHDQCANAVGCGVVDAGRAMWGMGTYACIVPVYCEPRDSAAMIERGLNTEHHAAPGRLVSFLYNQGGALVKWFRDTFAAMEQRQATAQGRDVYAELFAELPEGPSGLLVLPHFTATGPPEFIADSCGVVAELHLETPRGAIFKAILEGTTYYLRECLETLPATGIEIADYRAVGGGSRSDAWIQTCADIVGQPFTRPRVTEAGALGAALIAGVGVGEFASFEEGVEAMVELECTFEPDPRAPPALRWLVRAVSAAVAADGGLFARARSKRRLTTRGCKATIPKHRACGGGPQRTACVALSQRLPAHSSRQRRLTVTRTG